LSATTAEAAATETGRPSDLLVVQLFRSATADAPTSRWATGAVAPFDLTRAPRDLRPHDRTRTSSLHVVQHVITGDADDGDVVLEAPNT
jgi:hypothetical protein